VEGGERTVVGVNRFVEAESERASIHRHLEEVAEERRSALAALRVERDGARVASALHAVRTAASGGTNLVPVLVEAVKTYATIGEVCGVLRDVFGEYRAVQVY
jgi:methylmalonyl-CoA mutase N-terminal domain/subunit